MRLFVTVLPFVVVFGGAGATLLVVSHRPSVLRQLPEASRRAVQLIAAFLMSTPVAALAILVLDPSERAFDDAIAIYLLVWIVVSGALGVRWMLRAR
jgi:hypothetical protein